MNTHENLVDSDKGKAVLAHRERRRPTESKRERKRATEIGMEPVVFPLPMLHGSVL